VAPGVHFMNLPSRQRKEEKREIVYLRYFYPRIVNIHQFMSITFHGI
jgi:hypothetical protein